MVDTFYMHFKQFETNDLQHFLQPWWINFTCILCHLRRKLQKKSPTLVNKFYLHFKPFETNNLQNFLQRWTMVGKFYVQFKAIGGGPSSKFSKYIFVPQCIVNFVSFQALFTEFENMAPFGQNWT